MSSFRVPFFPCAYDSKDIDELLTDSTDRDFCCNHGKESALVCWKGALFLTPAALRDFHSIREAFMKGGKRALFRHSDKQRE